MFLFVSLFYWRIVALLKTAVLHRGWNDYETVVVWAGDRNQFHMISWWLCKIFTVETGWSEQEPLYFWKITPILADWKLVTSSLAQNYNWILFFFWVLQEITAQPLILTTYVFFSISVFIVMNVFILVSEEAITTPNVMYGDAVVSCILHTPY